MAKTIIDQLVVTLGLDPKQFKQGEKEAVEALRDLEKQGKKTGEEVSKATDKGGDSMLAFGKKVAVVALAVKALKLVVGVITDTAEETYALGNASRFLGESARNLRNFENVAEIFGGTADGAAKSIRGLKQSLFDLAFNGQVSNSIRQLSRLGVVTQGKGGKARDFKDVYLDTAEALHRNIANGTMSESDALMFAESAGFDPALSLSMVGGRDAATLALSQQEKRRQITGEDYASAGRISQSITSMGQAATATGVGAMRRGEGKVTAVVHGLEGAANAGTELTAGNVGAAWEAWREGMSDVSQNLGDFADNLRDGTSAVMEWANGVAGRTKSDRNNNPGNLTDGNGNFRTFATREEGLAAASRQLGLYRGRGNNTIRGMISKWNPAGAAGNSPANLAAYIADVSKQSGIDADAPTTSADDAALLAAMANHEGSKFRYDAAGVADALSLQEQASSSRFAGGSSGGDTKIDIGEVNVVTAATDAGGIASGIDGALKRKLTAAQAPAQGPN